MSDRSDHDPDRARRTAEVAARASYGKLIAILAARTRDIAAAEDALAQAFATALATWPDRGVPENPEGWLLTTARRTLLHDARHRKVRERAVEALTARAEETDDAPPGDARLQLLFVCAHPAIDESMRTPLMLQTVLGIDAQRIASAFLVAPATMSQRLVRTKAKIKAAGLRFEVPEPAELPERLEDVLQAIYVAYGTGWDDLGTDRGLTDEALYLGELVATLLPEEPEALGLLSLMLHCEARREARLDPSGRFVPLSEQDPSRWSRERIVRAEELLVRASRARRFGRFQCEAAIQSVHAQRAITGVLRHDALRTLYDLLLRHVPSVGVAVSRAAALVDAGAITDARAALDALSLDDVRSYQPYWVARAHLEARSGDPSAARASLERALGLTEDPAVRAFLTERLLAMP